MSSGGLGIKRQRNREYRVACSALFSGFMLLAAKQREYRQRKKVDSLIPDEVRESDSLIPGEVRESAEGMP